MAEQSFTHLLPKSVRSEVKARCVPGKAFSGLLCSTFNVKLSYNLDKIAISATARLDRPLLLCLLLGLLWEASSSFFLVSSQLKGFVKKKKSLINSAAV